MELRALRVLALLLLVGRAAAAEREDAAEVRALQRAALRAARLEDPTGGLRVRMHLAALLPQVGVTLGYGLQLAVTMRTVDGLAQPVSREGDKLSYAVHARWDLSRLLYGREEAGLLAHAQQAAQAGMTLAGEVAKLYYERRRLLRQEENGPEPGRRERIAEISARLDALTGFRSAID